MRFNTFAKRNLLENMREPLSYIFCIGFPLVMLVIMSIIDRSIPKEAHMTLFQLQNIGPGIMIFGFTFIMLFTCLSIATDRGNAFLIRLYASPMKGFDFITGYTVPMTVLSLMQCLITIFAIILLGVVTGQSFTYGYLFLNLLFLLPSMILFVGLGLLFGTLFNEKAAPGLCSIIICACGMIGGIWMDLDTVGGGFLAFCKVLPFYHCVKTARFVTAGDFASALMPFLLTVVYAVVVYVIAVATFRYKMQKDLK